MKNLKQIENKVLEIAADLRDLDEHGTLEHGIKHQIKKLDKVAKDLEEVQGSGTGRLKPENV